MHLQEITLFDLDLGVKVTRNVAQYPLHHVTYLGTKFKVAMSKGLGGDALTRNMTDARMDRQTDGQQTDFGTKLIYPFLCPQRNFGRHIVITLSVRPSVRLSRFRVRSISPIFFEVGIPNLVCGYILGWRSVAYHFRVTVTLTSDLVFRIIMSGAYLLYYLR